MTSMTLSSNSDSGSDSNLSLPQQFKSTENYVNLTTEHKQNFMTKLYHRKNETPM